MGGSITGRKVRRTETGAVTFRHVEPVFCGILWGFVGVVRAGGASGSVGVLLKDRRRMVVEFSGGVVHDCGSTGGRSGIDGMAVGLYHSC
jgi:hypothetical protein